jgi:ubiquinone/menaquinone biosynthesis C-methylase UbiE
MPLLKKLIPHGNREKSPEEGYNLWSSTYDYQPENLMLFLDEQLFTGFLRSVSLQHKSVLDFGCGTGRHWKSILQKQPAQMIGVDVSEGMLEQLKKKYPQAVLIQNKDNRLSELENARIDCLISTLTIAHIKNIEQLMASWNRLVPSGGDLFLTDYHPDLLQKGGKRDFMVNGKRYCIINYIHPLSMIKQLADGYGWKLVNEEQKWINQEVRSFYEQQEAMAVYRKFEGTPLIYGLHFTKP